MAGEETFVTIDGFPGYHVSDQGNVFSAKRGRLLTPVPDGDGYLTICLHKKCVPTRFKLHRLVCAAFHGPPAPEQQAAHLDGDKKNCRADNLVWASPKENTSHKHRHGTHQSGERHPRARLTESAATRAALNTDEERIRREAFGAGKEAAAKVADAHVKRLGASIRKTNGECDFEGYGVTLAAAIRDDIRSLSIPSKGVG